LDNQRPTIHIVGFFCSKNKRGEKLIYPVIDGAESFFIKGNSVGLLLSHGFLGTPQSVKDLGEQFAELGYTVYAPRLKGHGTHYKDVEKATHEEWLSDLEKGYKRLKRHCSVIYVVGQSMGGTLAILLANKQQGIDGLILINAALSVPSYESLRNQITPRYIEESKPDIKKQGVVEITYSKVPLRSIHQLQRLMNKITVEELRNVKIPLLSFKSLEDHVVPPENTDYIMQHVSSLKKRSISLSDSFHVASMDNDKNKIIRKTHAYIQENLQGTEISV
jgi:carboxylesterase